jgi:hypothetical protein
MRTYGATESNGTEGLAVLSLFVSVSLIVVGWAYLDSVLQALFVLIGVVGMGGSGYLMASSRAAAKKVG